ncbi:MAG: hypothetical protein ACLQBB_04395 [Solirubrobacteraceae bacterium]
MSDEMDSAARELRDDAWTAGRARGFLDALSSVDAWLVAPLGPVISANPEAQMVVDRYEQAVKLPREEASEVWAAHEARREAREA